MNVIEENWFLLNDSVSASSGRSRKLRGGSGRRWQPAMTHGAALPGQRGAWGQGWGQPGDRAVGWAGDRARGRPAGL